MNRNSFQIVLKVICSVVLILLVNACIPERQSKRDMNTPPKWGICTSVKNASKMQTAGYSYVEEGVQRLLK